MTKARAYPLEGDPDLLHVCWSVRERMRSTEYSTITHMVRRAFTKHAVSKTLCGKSCYGPGVYSWAFRVWSFTDDNLGVADIGCATCKRSRYLQVLDDNGKIPP